MQTAGTLDEVRTRTKKQVIGVAENDLGAEFLQFAGSHGLDRAAGADRHEDRCLDGSVRRFQCPQTRRAFRRLLPQSEMGFSVSHRCTNIPSRTASIFAGSAFRARAISTAKSNDAPGPFPVTRLPSRSVLFPV